jgi:hypothetical protein
METSRYYRIVLEKLNCDQLRLGTVLESRVLTLVHHRHNAVPQTTALKLARAKAAPLQALGSKQVGRATKLEDDDENDYDWGLQPYTA